MIQEVGFFEVEPDRAQEFEKVFAAAREFLASGEGCESVHLYRDVENPGSYMLHILWRRLGDHTISWKRNPVRQAFLDATRPFYRVRPEGRHFETVDANDTVSRCYRK